MSPESKCARPVRRRGDAHRREIQSPDHSRGVPRGISMRLRFGLVGLCLAMACSSSSAPRSTIADDWKGIVSGATTQDTLSVQLLESNGAITGNGTFTGLVNMALGRRAGRPSGGRASAANLHTPVRADRVAESFGT